MLIGFKRKEIHLKELYPLEETNMQPSSFRVIQLFISVLFFITACKRNEDSQCIYTVEQHEARLNDTIKYKKYFDEYGYLTYDERKNNFGSVYFFYKNKLHDYIFFQDEKRWNYFEKFDSLGHLRTCNSPLAFYNIYADSENHIIFYPNFILLNKQMIKLALRDKEQTTNIHLIKQSRCSNMYYCYVYLKKHDKESIKKALYFLDYTIQQCNGKIVNYTDTIFPPKVIRTLK